MVIKVAINGYGTIGKRVAHAINLQDDMKIIGVTKTNPTYQAKIAIEKGYDLYAADEKFLKNFKDAGIKIKGTLIDLLDSVDLVVDCTPAKKGIENLPLYEKCGVKIIFQGGEEHQTAGLSFNSMANYEKCFGADKVRIVSCNTTGLCRTLYPIWANIGIENVLAMIIRRAVDPNNSSKGPINGIMPELRIPSHHGLDVQTIIPIDVQTLAVKVPSTLMHVHSIVVKLDSKVNTKDIIKIWEQTPRVRFVSGKEGIKSTAEIMEYARDISRDRSDMYEIVIWEDSIHTNGKMLYYHQAIHQESDVVPENIDAIRAMCKLEKNKIKSIEKTNKSLKIIK